MTGTHRKLARIAIATVFIVLFAAFAAAPSFASRPTKADVASAKAKINAINNQLEVVLEQYNGARYNLQQVRQNLASARSAMHKSQAQADAARFQLGERAVQAYTGMGSQLDTLLAARDLSEFSDRLEFIGVVAQSDADLAAAADAARQRAAWASEQYNAALVKAQDELNAVNAKRSALSALLGQAEAIYKQTNARYAQYIAQQRAALLAQQQQDTTSAGGGSETGGGTGGYNPPPPNVAGAARAIDAARQELGVQYVFGAADPSVGFDCSGLTMWAWAQAGVSLPHSAAAQFAMLPHVDPSQMQPGDLLFFYSDLHHVALYIGGGMMIHARHPGPGGQVQIGSVAGYGTPLVGVVRP